MKAVIRISTRLRSSAPIPRDFLPITGLEHLGLIYQQKIITTPEEFNETLARVSDSRFPARGCAFFPYVLTAEDETKMNAKPAPVVVAEPEPEAAPAEDPAPAPEPDETSTPAFTLDGKAILLGDERVAGLFGEDKQLRVLAAYSELRPAIEAWLLTITPSES